MRQVLSLSLQEDTITEIKRRVSDRGFHSISDYFKYLINLENDMISEEELLKTVKQARDEYNKGKSIKANSIKDLL